jgi:hypothetical protein
VLALGIDIIGRGKEILCLSLYTVIMGVMKRKFHLQGLRDTCVNVHEKKDGDHDRVH